jgi:hypothetical protein
MTIRIAYLFLLPLLAALTITTLPVFASTGMSNCNDESEEEESEDCDTQADRVGNDDPNDEDADRDGADDEGEENCWGKVTSSLAHNEGEDEQPGIGEHSSNPFNDPEGEEEDRETPREGVGNQVEGHPSDHADTVGGLADDEPDCAQD